MSNTSVTKSNAALEFLSPFMKLNALTKAIAALPIPSSLEEPSATKRTPNLCKMIEKLNTANESKNNREHN